MHFSRRLGVFFAPALLAGSLLAQAPASAPPAETPDPTTPQHKGQIVIQSHGDPPADVPDQDNRTPPAQAEGKTPAADAKADVSDEQRASVTITSYDLDARLTLQRSGLSMRARVMVRNDGKEPLREVPLQISSSLHWESATLLRGSTRAPLTLAQHRLDTDTDHTGAVSEAVLPLPEPLAPGASVSLDLFYSGTLAVSGDRLARLGASTGQQKQADWDGVGPGWTGLRGFGNVLWYPVASPQLFLAEGNTLFAAVGQMHQREQDAAVRLRLSVEYVGEPPVAAYFCSRRADLKAVADDPHAPTAIGAGIATAEFGAEPLGFRSLSLFVIQQPETLLGSGVTGGTQPTKAGAEGASSSNPDAASPTTGEQTPAPGSGAQISSATGSGPVLALVSSDAGTAAGLGAAADRGATLLAEWLGPRPLSALTLLDHEGQPFQDGPLLVAPAATLQTSTEQPALVYSLAHGWVQTGQPWIDEGLAQFFALLSVERDANRAAAVAQLDDLLQPVALAEPNLSSATDGDPGHPILNAPDELFYRRKAAAVWWMLRDIAGEKGLRGALSAWRTQPVSHERPEVQALAFEHLLERTSGKDLGWFFADWVLRDRGLPDLSIADVAVSQTPAGPGHNTGWLVAVTVKNEGGAVADVPLIVRSGRFITTARVRVAGFSQTTQRVLVESEPTDIVVNDGGTPELRSSTHTRQLKAQPQEP